MDINTFGFDWGAGGFKLHGPRGGVEVPSQTAAATMQLLGEADGLRSSRPPLAVRLDGHRYYVGLGAHHWGRPVENLDDSRFGSGAPELMALVYASLAHYERRYGPVGHIDTLWVGLPQTAVRPEVAAACRGWLRGEHRYRTAWDGGDENERRATIGEVGITSQVTGGLYDYLLDDEGAFIAERKRMLKRELCVFSAGMNTIEMAVLENRVVNHRFDLSEPLGVRRLLELLDPRGYYSRGEMDAKLRSGSLDVVGSIPAWWSGIAGALENRLGNARLRFAMTVGLGGGVLWLRDSLAVFFGGKLHVPDDPVGAVARGLYKWGLLKASRKRGG